MRPEPITTDETASLGNAQQTMKSMQIRHLPVMSGGALVGILSERDILAARANADEDPWWKIPVRDAMQRPVHTAHPDDSVVEAAGRLAMSKIGSLPVVEHGKLVGIITVTDVLDAEVREAMEPTPKHRRTGYAT